MTADYEEELPKKYLDILRERVLCNIADQIEAIARCGYGIPLPTLDFLRNAESMIHDAIRELRVPK